MRIPLRAARDNLGWSQARLARASGISRATISAIETGRVVPSVEAALDLSRALGRSVEALFSPRDSKIDRWARTARRPPIRFWQASVRDRLIAYPAEPLLSGNIAHDGRLGADGAISRSGRERPQDTLVIATCDPTAGLLAEALSARGVRMIALARPGQEALRLLREGLVHVAGVHFSTERDQDANHTSIARALRGEPQVVLQYAEWDSGIALTPALEGTPVDALLDGRCRWINRPEGSGARACLDRLLAHQGDRLPQASELPGYDREARDHRAVAEMIATGFAEAGIAIRLCAEESNLGFVSLEMAHYDLCIPADLTDDRRIQALIEVTGERRYRQTLSELPGIGTRRTGAQVPI